MLWRYADTPAATDKALHFTDTDKARDFSRGYTKMGGGKRCPQWLQQREANPQKAGGPTAGSENVYELFRGLIRNQQRDGVTA